MQQYHFFILCIANLYYPSLCCRPDQKLAKTSVLQQPPRLLAAFFRYTLTHIRRRSPPRGRCRRQSCSRFCSWCCCLEKIMVMVIISNHAFYKQIKSKNQQHFSSPTFHYKQLFFWFHEDSSTLKVFEMYLLCLWLSGKTKHCRFATI